MGRPAQFLGTLAAALGLAVACLAPFAWRLHGSAGIEALAALALAGFLPGVVLAGIAPRVSGQQRDASLLLIGTLLRGGIVIVAALAVLKWRPELRSAEFFLALAGLYCVALAVETRALLAELNLTRSRQPQAN